MSDERRMNQTPRGERHPGAGHQGAGQPTDGELNVKAILGTGIALLVATLLGMAVSWWLSVGMRGHLEGDDPPPPTLLEAQMPYDPPSPNLQIDPRGELAAARAEEEALLTTWEWADAGRTRARVPIERAMELLLTTRPGAEAFDEGLSPQESHGE